MSVSMTMPILIVDDYNTMIRILRNLLRQLGFSNIDEACDGRAALAKLRAKDYALVISDTNMAPMSGMELLQRVRADERTKSLPFVMIANDPAEGSAAEECVLLADVALKLTNAQLARAEDATAKSVVLQTALAVEHGIAHGAFGVSRVTGYKWAGRYFELGD